MEKQKNAYIIGTFDTKSEELLYITDLLIKCGIETTLVDVSTSSDYQPETNITVKPSDILQFHPKKENLDENSNDRGAAIAIMKESLVNFIRQTENIDGAIGAGGSGNTDLVSAALRELPIGIPKVIVSTVGSGNISPYVGPNDISMVYSVTDVAGLNSISRKVLGNAAHSLAGMIANDIVIKKDNTPALGLTMFGVTTPCVDTLREKLSKTYDCLVFHATGVGGQSMEKLAESNLLVGAIDVTTTEVCDLIAGGVFAANEDRFERLAKSGLPYVGSCGALDMVNFGAIETVPEQYMNRNLYVHNANVTLMRTNNSECQKIGEFIARKLNLFHEPFSFLFPEKGFSLLDAEGQKFYDPEANNTLLESLYANILPTHRHRIISLPLHINDPDFAEALIESWKNIVGEKND
ncbi:MAG: hypothetical protein CMM30_00740 [Rhodospirillaceae bacterium]|nr:hypothetical protein [Rhodospirillaceae bacterium]|tara:strand:+ start:9021 stop:10247 length:1227 start_codon:yes stop_codon:yes gene_type:complete